MLHSIPTNVQKPSIFYEVLASGGLHIPGMHSLIPITFGTLHADLFNKGKTQDSVSLPFNSMPLNG